MDVEGAGGKIANHIHRLLNAESGRIDKEIIGVGGAPCALRIEVIIVGALTVASIYHALCGMQAHVLTLHDASKAVLAVSTYKYTDAAWVSAENIVGSTAYNNAGVLTRCLTYGSALESEEATGRELIVVEIIMPHHGGEGADDASQETAMLIRTFKDITTYATVLGCQTQNLAVVVGNAKLCGQRLTNLSATTANLSANADDIWPSLNLRNRRCIIIHEICGI